MCRGFRITFHQDHTSLCNCCSGGLQAGDVITAINEKAVVSSNDVFKAVDEHEVLHIKVRRKNQVIMLTVKPEEVM